MESALKIQAHYNFTEHDVKNLTELGPIMDRYKDEFPRQFYNHVRNYDEADRFLKDEETIKKHQEALTEWFLGLFDGEYGPEYIHDLKQIGQAHVNIRLNTHYVNASMHFVKSYCREVLEQEVKSCDKLTSMLGSVEKILDINLDVMTNSFVEEEKKKMGVSSKVENVLIQFSNRFSYWLNIVLVLGLVALGFMVLGLFVYDLTHIFAGDIEKGLLSTLGSLLMLWVVIELVDTEIEHLKGEKFAIKVFVSVALVAVIRKILVTTLKADAVDAQISLIAAVAVLGVVYWLVSKSDKANKG